MSVQGGGAPLLLTLPQNLPQHDALAAVTAESAGLAAAGGAGGDGPVREEMIFEAGAPLALALPPMEMVHPKP